MNKIKKYIRPTIIWFIFLIVYLFLLVLLNYFQVLKLNSIIKFNFVTMALISFFFGLALGKKTTKKGYLEGLKLGFIIIFILLVLNLIFIRAFNLNVFVYYLIILVGSIFGSMIGINIKKK